MVPEGGVAGVGTPIAFVAETEADLEAAKAKAAGALSCAKSKRLLYMAGFAEGWPGVVQGRRLPLVLSCGRRYG